MPRTKFSTNPSATSSSATLNDLSHPYPTPSTSPLLVPTLPPPPSPLSALAASFTIKTPNKQHVHDSTLSLPVGTTLSIPRKNGSRIGQSILGQLLAAHKPGRDHHKLASDAALSLETIRPKEQQRRSILPASWTINFQKPSSTPSSSAKQQSVDKMTPLIGSSPHIGRNVMENSDQNEHHQPMLPSVWLENVLSRLSRSDTNIPPHYATLPRVTFQDRAMPLRSVFADSDASVVRDKKDERRGVHKIKTALSSSNLNPRSKVNDNASPKTTNSPTMTRRGSACELALGDDAHELFHQNRPKALSSAVISSSIVPPKETSRNVRQHSLDSTMFASKSTKTLTVPEHLPSSSTESYPPPGTTTKTTRGRFTIESSSTAPNPFRTRTLSCTAASAPQILAQHQQHLSTSQTSSERPLLSITTPPPALSVPLPTPSSPSTNNGHLSSFSTPRSIHTAVPPSPSSPTATHVTGHQYAYDQFSSNSNSNSNSSTTTPISIPLASKPNHQRTHSSSSVQSSASTSSRRSQVIIPPPASASSLHYASFSSITSTGPVSNASPLIHHQNLSSRRSTINNNGGATNSNNFRNLSIQIVNGGDKADGGQDSHDSQVFHMETPTVHPLDEDTSVPATSVLSSSPSSSGIYEGANAQAGPQAAHQTMNRVHPRQDSIDSPAECHAPMTTSSSASGLNSGLNNNGRGGAGIGVETGAVILNQQFGRQVYDRDYSAEIGYFRQRSLSTTNVDMRNTFQKPSIHGHQQLHEQPLLNGPPQGFSWNERPTRRSHGSVSSADHHHHPHRSGTPIRYMSENTLGPMSSSYNCSSSFSSSLSSTSQASDIVVVKKSATGRMFTVERTLPASPTKSSRFIVMSSTDDLCASTPSPPARPASPLQKTSEDAEK
ncbi:hypothetical protein BX616_006767 [Lobosporangium transversale]|uniref:Uncharacterized protein n=1 Tax=Lobosporangium transversale TaxID=64571 RepID=A0A1Y2GF54_9FUNG|nr:hypothetical protein BCR41DRAFT_398951 [Lobosporangium transversale]KAF9915164.1 hypothetical protein BX616_006767 [Lobosporangium transversale]ORZ09084.1 hypothetical protein BCR41DRAFT_398951 [Lobosporangium transversale]|eukprot:XP_021878711.1 hypothetical protein BCR41DRAFT_398951 [Lobosporangium transversale]